MSRQNQPPSGGAARKPLPASAPAQSKNRRFFWKVFSSFTALYLALNLSGKCRIVTREYEIADARIASEVRICIISDLHGALYGRNHENLLSAVESARPDTVLLLGDLFDQHTKSADNTETLLRALSERYPCYFILGNHEYKTCSIDSVCDLITESGIPILAGDSVLLPAGASRIRIFGIDDGLGGKRKQLRQIAEAAEKRSDLEFSILAIHVPNSVESYLEYGFDLILSGHTHGGQIILPGLLNGLYAPGQGLFPKYGGGRYDFESTTLIISRGLARKPLWLPRICNPPELSVVVLKPAAEP